MHVCTDRPFRRPFRRNGTTTYTYYDNDQVETVTTPVPSGTEAAQLTTYQYDEMGRRKKTILPDTTETNNQYWPTGELKQQSGSQTYAVDYTYDSQGRMKTLTTTGQAGTEVTTWYYDPLRGWLAAKRYPDDKGSDYTYTPAGRIETRTWERGVVTTYGYTDAGDLETVDYSDTTPDVGYGYDRRGRRAGVTDGSGTCSIGYNAASQLETETYTGGLMGGLMGGLSLTHGYDTLLRRNTLTVKSGTTMLHSQGFGYDDASRLETVTAGSDSATYGYLTNSPLVETVTFKHSGTTVMTTDKDYDLVNRLTSTLTVSGTATVSERVYGYNALNQREQVDLADGGYWLYGYNAKGEVINGTRYNSSDVAITGQNFGYQFDGIGNRTLTTIDTVASGTYASNTLNQYAQIVATGTTNPTHDFDGNLTDDGTKVYEWDGENRLKAVKRKSDNALIATYTYDEGGHRVRTETTSIATQGATDRTFLFDGWNNVAQFAYNVGSGSHQLHQGYVWGLDLSGSQQGAGGVGGLAIETDAATGVGYWPSFDGNGNVMNLVKSSDGSTVATYEYDPFGKLLSSSGSYANANPFRHATKFFQAEIGWYYYGYRYYNPETGRWPSRDPIEEKGGANVYSFVNNQSTNSFDMLGLYTIADATNSLTRPPGYTMRPPARQVTMQEIFDEWYRLEKTRGKWWTSLPQCPRRICITGKSVTNPYALDPSKWQKPGPIRVPHVERFHPGAIYEMRSVNVGGHSNQCTYDEQGIVITAPPAMGTVDYVAPDAGVFGHWDNDVATIIFAANLDGKWSAAFGGDPFILGNLLGFISHDAAGRLTGVGSNMMKYFEVRPSYSRPPARPAR